MKTFTLFLLFSIASFTGFSQAKISGVITYYFNEYQGNKPDIGASVILIDSSKATNFNYKNYENFYYGKTYQKMYFSALERYENYTSILAKLKKGKKYDADREKMNLGIADAQKDMDKYAKEMTRYDFDSAEKSAKTGVDVYVQLLKLDEDLPKKTVDSNGNYSMNIEPGVYYVYIKSKNRTSLLMPESDGNIYIKKVKISENGDKDISYNFEL